MILCLVVTGESEPITVTLITSYTTCKQTKIRKVMIQKITRQKIKSIYYSSSAGSVVWVIVYHNNYITNNMEFRLIIFFVCVGGRAQIASE